MPKAYIIARRAISYRRYIIRSRRERISLKKDLVKNDKVFFMVEMAVVETASENPLPQLSTSVSVLLGFPSGDAGRQASPYGSL